jgi:hypothetical protein
MKQSWLNAMVICVLALATPSAHAKTKRWDITCQKVFVTGIQQHEIAWALKGEGLENNLYKNTCMQPVADASEADAILDIELDPEVAGNTERRIQEREDAIKSGEFWVHCNSDTNGSYCLDSAGYSLQTSCTETGCSTYYGPDPGVAFVHAVGDALSAWIERSAAWAYMYSVKDHSLIWKYEGAGQWHFDLTKYAQCTKRAGTYGQGPCKKPKALLP